MNTTDSPLTRQLFNAVEVRRALELMLPPGQVTEVRLFDAVVGSDRRAGVYSGYFDNHDAILDALQYVHESPGFYFVPNPVNPDLLARRANRLCRVGDGEATSDRDIIRRRWLLIDLDVIRPTGISSSDDEHEAALDRGELVELFLHDLGFPDPIRADSGNGCHLCYSADLPVNDGGLIQRCLAALGARFTDAAVKVDQTTFNPARIWKIPGTMVCKGDSIPTRPHRFARILEGDE